MNQPVWSSVPPDAAKADPAQLSLLGHDLRAAVSDVLGGLRQIDHSQIDPATVLQLERVRAAGEVLARLLEESLAAMLGDDPMDGRQIANVQMSRFLYDIEVRWSGRAREKGLDFQIVVEPGVPAVLALDRIALERVLANILSNAIKYTDAGTVRMRVELTEENGLRLSVHDEGPGFSEEALGRLFQYAGRPEGADKPGHGMGLHISQDMAHRLGGNVSVHNRPGGGADVAFDLPATAWRPVAPGVRADLPDLSRIKVLLAEDNITNQTIICHMLAAMGAEFELATDGVEALHWLEREEFDLALIDIEMPRLSGIDVIRALRAAGGAQSRMPVLAVTAYVLRANRDAIYAAGADGILAKPLPGIESFGLAIAAALARAEAHSAIDTVRPDETVELDLAQFERLMEIAGPDNAGELLDRLHSDLRKTERGLIAALSDTDRGAIRSATHVLIALAGAVGAERLQALAETVNAAAHRREDAPMKTLAAETLAQIDRLIEFVRREIDRRGTLG
ncbi:ATP-binding protein [Frigidibacter mobilis]|uniref:histidine kinase n=1 Tax=Frigidibacter mobilis TaxID=1335048 RepID=A0A159Z5W0_9RHOB|nr:ATP-binding protein [Frigidibacter mobilis]AMY70671.1 aerobic respiration control sensor protein [Frigidibacter mobilis]